MKNHVVYHKLYVQVENILEIRICNKAWEKIKSIAALNQTSYSWVVRYVTFRLIKRKNIRNFLSGDMQFENFLENKDTKGVKANFKKKQMHRHRLCLYGDDELYIRIAAGKLGCTMSQLIRYALELYLNELLIKSPVRKKSRFLRAAYYWLGIKHFEGVEIPTLPLEHKTFQFQRYPLLSYW